MDAITLRLTTYDGSGAEKQTVWSFTPLRNQPSYPQARQSGTDAEGRMRRRPYNVREQRAIKLPAGLLLDDTHWQNFLRLTMAHKIELQRTVGRKTSYVEYDLDEGQSIDFDFVEDIDRLRSHTIKLVMAQPIWYDEFEKRIEEITNA